MEMRKNGIDVIVEEVGFLVFREKLFLGVSIDRIIIFKDIEEKWGMEIKFFLSKVGMIVEEVCKNKIFFLEKFSDGIVRFKWNYDYYL